MNPQLTDVSREQLETAIPLAHTHSNKPELDSITGQKITEWNNKQDRLSNKQLENIDSVETIAVDVDNHISDTASHTNNTERATWNAKQNALTAQQITNINNIESIEGKIDSHVSDNVRHIENADRTRWNGKENVLTAGSNISINRTNPESPVINAVVPPHDTDHSKLDNLGFDNSGHTGFARAVHIHAIADVTELGQTITRIDNDVSDVDNELQSHTDNKLNPHGVTAQQAGARANTWVPSWNEVTDKPTQFEPTSHTHTKSNITDFAHNHQRSEITDFAHSHLKADITDFAHNHEMAQVNGLIDELNGLDDRIDAISNLGRHVGTFDTFALLPKNTSGLPVAASVNDFANVRVDETRNNETTRYIIDNIDASGAITWNFDITYDTDISGKADRVSGATAGNLAGLNAQGNLTDSTITPSSIVRTTGNQEIFGIKTFKDNIIAENGISVANQRIVNLGNPTQPQDAANKRYIDDTFAEKDWVTDLIAKEIGDVIGGSF